jgi:hypothetical protein
LPKFTKFIKLGPRLLLHFLDAVPAVEESVEPGVDELDDAEEDEQDAAVERPEEEGGLRGSLETSLFYTALFFKACS